MCPTRVPRALEGSVLGFYLISGLRVERTFVPSKPDFTFPGVQPYVTGRTLEAAAA